MSICMGCGRPSNGCVCAALDLMAQLVPAGERAEFGWMQDGPAATFHMHEDPCAVCQIDAARNVPCQNCGLPVTKRPPRGHRLGPSGYTHYDWSAPRGGWNGVRCPGRITGAVPSGAATRGAQ